MCSGKYLVIRKVRSILLKKHENSATPLESMSKWLDMEQRLLDKWKSIDYEKQLRFQEARKHWQDLLERLLHGLC
jgi:hypothetical protein